MPWLCRGGFGMKIVQLVTAGPRTCCNKLSKVEKYHVSINTKPEHQTTTDCFSPCCESSNSNVMPQFRAQRYRL